MLRASMVDGRTDLGTLASGQVAGVIDDLPSCGELVQRIIAQATDVLERLGAPGSGAAQREATKREAAQRGATRGGATRGDAAQRKTTKREAAQ
jgi:hypothetical protein